MKRRIVVLFCGLLIAVAGAWAQGRQTLRRLTTEDGLPSNTVRNIVQDRQGFIWLGTDKGLCRYDGVQVRVFRIPENGIDQFVMSLTAEGDSLLLSTARGVFSFSPRTERFRRLEGMKGHQTGRGDRLQTHDGRLWVGTWEEGLMLMADNKAPQQILSPVRDGVGHHIHKLFEFDQRYVLIGCDEGLVAYDMQTGQTALWDTPKFVYSIERDHEGGLWLGTFYDGVCYLNDVLDRFERVPGHVISRFCEDGAGRLWIASDDAGLSCIVDGAEHDYPGRAVMAHENVHALQQDGDYLWVGTYAGGVYRLSGSGAIRHYTTDDGLHDNSSYVIYRDRQQLWVATMTGLCRYDEANDRFVLVKELAGVAVSMTTDRQGRLWIATQGGGLYRYDNKTWKQYQHGSDATSLDDTELNCVFATRDGHLWVATESGLCLYRPESDNFRRVFDGKVSSIVESADGDELWLATEKGVLRFRGASSLMNNRRYAVPARCGLPRFPWLHLFRHGRWL